MSECSFARQCRPSVALNSLPPYIPYCAQDIDLEGFQAFMDTYLEMDTPRDLVKHLFLSFVRKPAPPRAPIADGRLLKFRHLVAGKFQREESLDDRKTAAVLHRTLTGGSLDKSAKVRASRRRFFFLSPPPSHSLSRPSSSLSSPRRPSLRVERRPHRSIDVEPPSERLCLDEKKKTCSLLPARVTRCCLGSDMPTVFLVVACVRANRP
ncbi:hypothetical protein HPB48_016902 [Haemaphysalis longicornis]|uniref:Diacylglycerol kinase type I N-terminal domain-containing protein n=1 Tax=Haemaphysalis longicornis TaxID=44386 RepID=A0A9J6G298_HAELO|nr:hypothetical protein HPB48_016902 [Haemaphysalis longicornis]